MVSREKAFLKIVVFFLYADFTGKKAAFYLMILSVKISVVRAIRVQRDKLRNSRLKQ